VISEVNGKPVATPAPGRQRSAATDRQAPQPYNRKNARSTEWFLRFLRLLLFDQPGRLVDMRCHRFEGLAYHTNLS
jgi:hypothetical protein